MSAQPLEWLTARDLRLATRLSQINPELGGRGLIREGILRRAVGLTLEAIGCEAPMGATCKVEVVDGGWVDAEVVGFSGERTYLMPSAELHGLREREAMLWLAQHEANPADAHWCAIDDAPGNWLSRSRLILTDFKRGFTVEDADALRRMLLGFRAGTDRPLEPAVTSLWARNIA